MWQDLKNAWAGWTAAVVIVVLAMYYFGHLAIQCNNVGCQIMFR